MSLVKQILHCTHKSSLSTFQLWNDRHARDQVVPALKESLARLGLDYIDLFLIHFPIPLKVRRDYYFVTFNVNRRSFFFVEVFALVIWIKLASVRTQALVEQLTSRLVQFCVSWVRLSISENISFFITGCLCMYEIGIVSNVGQGFKQQKIKLYWTTLGYLLGIELLKVR